MAEMDGDVVGAMGIQKRSVPPADGMAPHVVLVSHAYTRLAWQRRGISTLLLNHLLA